MKKRRGVGRRLGNDGGVGGAATPRHHAASPTLGGGRGEGQGQTHAHRGNPRGRVHTAHAQAPWTHARCHATERQANSAPSPITPRPSSPPLPRLAHTPKKPYPHPSSLTLPCRHFLSAELVTHSPPPPPPPPLLIAASCLVLPRLVCVCLCWPPCEAVWSGGALLHPTAGVDEVHTRWRWR